MCHCIDLCLLRLIGHKQMSRRLFYIPMLRLNVAELMCNRKILNKSHWVTNLTD